MPREDIVKVVGNCKTHAVLLQRHHCHIQFETAKGIFAHLICFKIYMGCKWKLMRCRKKLPTQTSFPKVMWPDSKKNNGFCPKVFDECKFTSAYILYFSVVVSLALLLLTVIFFVGSILKVKYFKVQWFRKTTPKFPY